MPVRFKVLALGCLVASFSVACGNEVNVPMVGFDATIDANLNGDMGVLPTDMARPDMTTILPDLGRDMPPPMCGNFVTETGEACDDGNMLSNDGCSADCMTVEGTCAVPLDFAELATDVDGVLSFSADTLSASNLLAGSCGGDEGHDFVFTYTPTESGLFTISTDGSSFDTILYARTACAASTPEYDCDDDGGSTGANSKITFFAEAGVAMFIVVDGYDAEDDGAFTLSLNRVDVAGAGEACDPTGSDIICQPGLLCAPSGVGDERTCQAGADLGCGVDVPVFELPIVDGVASGAGSTIGSANVITGSCASSSGSNTEVAYHFVMPVTGNFEMNMTADFDSVTYVYQTMCGALPNEVICSDSSSFGNVGQPDIPMGTEVYLVVDGWSSTAAGAFDFTLTFSASAGEGAACGDSAPEPHCGTGLICRTEGEESFCRPVMCNDGTIEGDEQCEDGNVNPGDGCSADCRLEDQGIGGDVCAGALPLFLAPTTFGDLEAIATGDTTGQSPDYTNMCDSGPTAPDVVYAVTVPTEGYDLIAYVETDSETYEPSIALRGGGDCADSATEIDCDVIATAYAYQFDATPGTYFIIVDGYSTDDAVNRGPYSLHVSLSPSLDFEL